MIDPDTLARIRAYVCCEPDSQPPTHADLQALLAEVDRLASGLADADRARALLCTDGTLTAAVEHLGSILHDAGIGLPACDRAPTCQSLHLSTRIHNLADQRDAARREFAAIDTITPGGPMPEPWPGMGVERIGDDGSTVIRYIADPVQVGGVWFVTAAGNPDLPEPDGNDVRYEEITAIYDGRRRIWQRNP